MACHTNRTKAFALCYFPPAVCIAVPLNFTTTKSVFWQASTTHQPVVEYTFFPSDLWFLGVADKSLGLSDWSLKNLDMSEVQKC